MYVRIILIATFTCATISAMETDTENQFKQSLIKAYAAFNIKKEITLDTDLINTIKALPKNSDLLDFYAHMTAADTKNYPFCDKKIYHWISYAIPPLAGIDTLLVSLVFDADPFVGLFASVLGFATASKVAKIADEIVESSAEYNAQKLTIQKLLEKNNPKPISTWLAYLHKNPRQNESLINAAIATLDVEGYGIKIESPAVTQKVTVTIRQDEEAPIATSEMIWNIKEKKFTLK